MCSDCYVLWAKDLQHLGRDCHFWRKQGTYNISEAWDLPVNLYTFQIEWAFSYCVYIFNFCSKHSSVGLMKVGFF